MGAGDGVPSWGYWSQVFSFMLRIAAWESNPKIADDAYVASSNARDLFEEFEMTFRAIRLRLPRPEPHPGESYLGVFGAFLEQLESWLEGASNG